MTPADFIDRFDITLTEYPEDPWGRVEGAVFHVTAAWKTYVRYTVDEQTIPTLAIGRGATAQEAVDDFRASLERRIERLADERRLREIQGNPTSVERITL